MLQGCHAVLFSYSARLCLRGPRASTRSSDLTATPSKVFLTRSEQRTADPSRSPGAPCLYGLYVWVFARQATGGTQQSHIMLCPGKKLYPKNVDQTSGCAHIYSWKVIRDAAKNCHLLTQHVAQSLLCREPCNNYC